MISVNYKNRIQRLQEALKQKGLEAALISKFQNVTYLSGFTGDDSYLLIFPNEFIFITDSRYTEQASKQAQDYLVVDYKGKLIAAFSEFIDRNKIKKIGFEDKYLSFSWYRKLADGLDVSLEPLNDSVDVLRSVKDASETDKIKKAAKIADDAFEQILNLIKPGVSESEVATELEYIMKKLGAAKPSFDTVAASGERSSLPHGTATGRKLQYGDAITLDFGAVFDGYCSDITRTVFLGKPDEEKLKVYNIVLEAQKRALEGAFSGKTGREIDAYAREYISEAGYGGFFGHGLGHGLGLEIHEEPRFSPSYTGVITDGMVVTVEPGIYLPGKFGVRIEDDIVVNGREPIILTTAPKNPIML